MAQVQGVSTDPVRTKKEEEEAKKQKPSSAVVAGTVAGAVATEATYGNFVLYT